MQLFSNKKLWLAGLATVMVLFFFLFRPLNAPAYRIIAADGLGYYSYLPAQFIHHDQQMNFAWFDEVFNQHYDNHLFEKPSENFMVAYGDKKINKYYPGQSLLQLPFFLMAHGAAKLFKYPADGFSFPYQLAIGFAALFYTFIGLLFCAKLLFETFNDRLIALLVPMLIFFGTNLFTYTIFNGCYSHAYSFCFVSLAFYSAFKFFNELTQKIKWLLLFALFSLVVVTIRPLNALLLPGVLYFYKPLQITAIFKSQGKKWLSVFLIIMIALIGFYNLRIIYIQTGSFLLNTYAGERFYFDDFSHVAANFFGFQYGMLWYCPLIVMAIAAVFFVRKNPRLLYLLFPVLLLIVLYSCWWYWSITSRVIVDCSTLLALLLTYLLVQLKSKPATFRLASVVVFLCVPLFQLKAYQLRNSILDANYVYDKYYFKHFFTIRDVNTYPVDPASIIRQQAFFYDYESKTGPEISELKSFEGRRSALLNVQNEFACTATYTIPVFFNENGFKKIRVAFWLYTAGEIKDINLVFTFTGKDSALAYIPFYMNDLHKNRWDFNEFGLDLPANVHGGDILTVYLWNPGHKNEAFIDNLKLEFFLTDGSNEITLK
ncbi:MAG: hypothetical protein V4635_03860 [Bacteroidota bacterium]